MYFANNKDYFSKMKLESQHFHRYSEWAKFEIKMNGRKELKNSRYDHEEYMSDLGEGEGDYDDYGKL